MTSSVTFQIRDFSDEYSTLSFVIPDVNAANYDATITQITALQLAVAAITLGNITSIVINVDTGLAGADVRPASANAQRENGLRLYFQDTVNGEKYSRTIAAPDLTLVAQGGTDNVDLTFAIVAPLVAAFEALTVSKDGNPVVVNRGRVVGRAN